MFCSSCDGNPLNVIAWFIDKPVVDISVAVVAHHTKGLRQPTVERGQAISTVAPLLDMSMVTFVIH